MIHKATFICYSTPNISDLTSIFMTSLQNLGVKQNSIVHKLDVEFNNIIETQFRDSHWYSCTLNKLEYTYNILKKYTEYNTEFFIFSDTDIWFPQKNKETWLDLEQHINNSNRDIFFAEEGRGDINTGFYIIKRNSIPELLPVYKDIITIYTQLLMTGKLPKFGEQCIFNDRKHLFNYGVIPSKYIILGPVDFNNIDKDCVLLHHAVRTKNKTEKLQQMHMYMNFICS